MGQVLRYLSMQVDVGIKENDQSKTINSQTTHYLLISTKVTFD